MKVWIVVTGEPLPIDEDRSRLYRGGIFCQYLSDHGHEVTWWSSDFNHANKKPRFNKFTHVELSTNFKLELLHGIPYKRNVSFSRIINHIQLGRQFSRIAYEKEKPDIIFSALPTIELCHESVVYGKKMNVPVVVDIRDMWPDVFEEIAPKFAQPLLHLLTTPLRNTLKKTLINATAITGITLGYVNWALNYAGRSITPQDGDFPLGYVTKEPSEVDKLSGFDYWRQLGISNDPQSSNICFFGSIGRYFDFDTVIEAAQKLFSNKNVRFIICGSGEKLNDYRIKTRGMDNIFFPGLINASQIWTLMRISRMGLAPYKNLVNFMENCPNKPIEYLSASLPIISCLRGNLEKLIKDNDCGIQYEEKNSDSLIEAINGTIQNPSILPRLSKNAKNLFEDKFQAENVYKNLTTHLTSVVGHSLTSLRQNS